MAPARIASREVTAASLLAGARARRPSPNSPVRIADLRIASPLWSSPSGKWDAYEFGNPAAADAMEERLVQTRPVAAPPSAGAPGQLPARGKATASVPLTAMP